MKRIQQLLIKAGINVVGGADGIFGPQTKRSVQRLPGPQRAARTGAVDAATDAALAKVAGGAAAAPTPSTSYIGLRIGSTGPAVTKVQQAIMATGLVLRGGADGIFGQRTHNAVVIYQRANGLTQTGIVDEATARLLGLTSAHSDSGSSDRRRRDGGRLRRLRRAGRPRRRAAEGADQRPGSPSPAEPTASSGRGRAGAIMKFQQATGCATGKVDQATAGALGLAAMAAPTAPHRGQRRAASRPVAGPCYYGDTWQAPRGGGRVHLGVDIGAPEGTPLRAVVTGRVIQIYHDRPGSLSGNGIKIGTADGTYFFYAHLADFAPGSTSGSGHGRPDDRLHGQHGQRGDHPPALRGPPSRWCGGQSVPVREGHRRLLTCASLEPPTNPPGELATPW